METIVKNNKANSISFIKMLAAFQVMLGHMFLHLEVTTQNWFSSILYFFAGVPIFFIISGYLIWMSIRRQNSYVSFIQRRFWRIYPELWGAVIVEILSIMLLYSAWNFKDLIKFTIAQSTFFQFWTPETLRGYGCGTPNGSLWTITVIVQFYIISWFVYKTLHGKKIVIWVISLVAAIGFSILGQYGLEFIGVEVITKLYDQTILRYLWLFLFGCFIAENKAILVDYVLKKYWYLFILAACFPYITSIDIYAGYKVLHSILLVAGLIGFAYATPKVSIEVDISYGVFLYHMIIANIFIDFGWTRKWIYVIGACFLSTVTAFISHRIIGVWSAKKKEETVETEQIYI